MRYITFFITLILILTAPLAAAQDAERRYRVELIVLMHLEHAEEPRERKWLTDYAEALDLLAPPEEGEEPADESEVDAAAAEAPGPAGPGSDAGTDAGTAEALPPGPEVADEEADPYASVAHLPEPGPEMAEAWRRLRLSGPFRPLQYLSWEQDGSEPFPRLRVHDEEVVQVQDPWAEARAELELEQQEPRADAAPRPATAGDAVEPTDEEPPLPPPTLYYQLDGTAQLTRSRFLHLALDLEWRQPVFDPTAATVPAAAAEPALAPEPEHFRVFQLQQRRQVRTGRMEYFDGPVLGVLARVTRVRSEAPDPADTGEAAQEWSE